MFTTEQKILVSEPSHLVAALLLALLFPAIAVAVAAIATAVVGRHIRRLVRRRSRGHNVIRVRRVRLAIGRHRGRRRPPGRQIADIRVGEGIGL